MVILGTLIRQKRGLNIDSINPEIFKFAPCVQFFKDFQYKTFKDILYLKTALTRSIFELEK